MTILNLFSALSSTMFKNGFYDGSYLSDGGQNVQNWKICVNRKESFMYILHHLTPHHPSPHHHHQNPDNDHHHLLDEYDTEDNQNNCSYCLQDEEEQVSRAEG